MCCRNREPGISAATQSDGPPHTQQHFPLPDPAESALQPQTALQDQGSSDNQHEAQTNQADVNEANVNEAELNEEEVNEQIQARLPGPNWRERIGAAGTSLEQQRVSPIVELSMILVRDIHML